MLTQATRFLLFLLALLLLCLLNTHAQEIGKKNDLSQVKVDQLSDEEITQYRQQFMTPGLTEEQGYEMMLSRGLPATELEKLKRRLQQIAASSVTERSQNTIKNETVPKTAVKEIKEKEDKTGPQVFGADLFSSHSLTFEPDLNIATPMNYVLGVNDGLQVTVYGTQEVNFKVLVSPEGSIYIPNVGIIQVAGENFESAIQLIKQRMSATAYPTLKTGASKLAVNLSKIRSIHITVVGGFKPGNYTVSSLSTVFNALYYAGGPAANGSYREIELLRNNKLYRKIDLYRFLLKGDQSDNVRLEDNDVIRIPVYRTRVTISGEVKRPGIFEVLPDEHLSDLIDFAAGFSDSAFRASISVVQLTDAERKLQDVSAADYNKYVPQAGDQFTVSKILNRFKNRVSIEGAVYRPGAYELVPGLTVGALIRKAYGLREDAYAIRGQLIRLQEDLTEMVIPFDVKAVLGPSSGSDIQLMREDRVVISSINDLRDKFTVSIEGEVRHPGDYNYVDNLSLKDLIIQAGGFTDAALPQTIEIGRMIKRNALKAEDVKLSEVIEISNGEDLRLSSANLQLKPYDVVTVRRKPGYTKVRTASVTGEIQYPGPYVIETTNERISSLVKRAGGFAPYAYVEGAYLKRLKPVTVTSEIKADKVAKVEQSLKDTSGTVEASATRPYDQVPLNLKQIIAKPGSAEDLILQQGDELFIPKEDAQVHITGEVLSPTQLPYQAEYSLKDYIAAAGGFTEDANKRKLYVLHANGKAETDRGFLFFRHHPKVQPGSEIIIPKHRERKGLSNGEIIGFSGILISMASVIVALLR